MWAFRSRRKAPNRKTPSLDSASMPSMRPPNVLNFIRIYDFLSRAHSAFSLSRVRLDVRPHRAEPIDFVEGRVTVKRAGLWAIGIAALAGVSLLSREQAYAGENDHPAKCSLATLNGQYLFCRIGNTVSSCIWRDEAVDRPTAPDFTSSMETAPGPTLLYSLSMALINTCHRPSRLLTRSTQTVLEPSRCKMGQVPIYS